MKRVLILLSIMAIALLTGCNFFPGRNTPPEASFTCLTEKPVTNEPVFFSAAASNDKEDGNNLLTRWDFNGDGTYEIDFTAGIKTTQKVSYTYTIADTYSVILEVRDTKDKITKQVRLVTVAEGNTAPTASFSIFPAQPVTDKVVTFDASACSDPEDGQNLEARWDFDGDEIWDVDYSAGKKVTDSVTHTYATSGLYNVTLEVKDTAGLTKAFTKEISVLEASTTAFIKGAVVESKGGAGISGATVTYEDNNGIEWECTSEANGSFGLQIHPGSYQITVAKAGYAVSRVQGLDVDEGEEFMLNLPLKTRLRADWPIQAPTITVGDFPASTPDEPLSGLINFEIAGWSDVGIKLMEVRFNSQGQDADLQFVDKAHGLVEYDTANLPDGKNYIKISAYDGNNNYVEWYKTIYVLNNPEPADLPKPVITNLQALTFGMSLDLLSTGSRSKAGQALFKKALAQRLLPRYESNFVPLAERDNDTTIVTTAKWAWVENAHGYKVYRKFEDESGYTLIASTTNTGYVDNSPELLPGRKVYYQVTAYRGAAESAASSSAYTVPLGTFNVSLVAPADRQVVTTPSPTLQWTTGQTVGSKQMYHVVIWGVTDNTPVLNTMVDSATYLTGLSIALESGKEYEWDILEAQAWQEYTPISSAVAFSGQGDGSINGAFTFTTKF